MRILAKAIAVSLLLPAPVMADPAGLVLDVSGTIQPQVGLFEEIDDGTVLHLGSGATLTISHYGSCQEVSLTGGTVAVGADKLLIEGGKILSRADVQCPGQIVMAAADLVNMAVTLRSAMRARTMAPEPEFVLVGAWGKQFDRLDVYSQEGHVGTLPVSRGHAAWPDALAPLAAGATYVVVLNGPGAKQHAARIEVSGDPPGMTVLKGK